MLTFLSYLSLSKMPFYSHFPHSCSSFLSFFPVEGKGAEFRWHSAPVSSSAVGHEKGPSSSSALVSRSKFAKLEEEEEEEEEGEEGREKGWEGNDEEKLLPSRTNPAEEKETNEERELSSVQFFRSSTSSFFTLGPLSLSFEGPALVGLYGPVGAGKSSLLASVLGELDSVRGGKRRRFGLSRCEKEEGRADERR